MLSQVRSRRSRRLARLVLAGLLVLTAGMFASCTRRTTSPPATPSPSPSPETSAPSPVREPSCPPFEESVVTGTVSDPELDEISGIVAGRRIPGVLWAEEDSGNDPSVFALTPSGKVVARVAVDGATNRDWEALAWAMGRLWIGDIGDNEGERSEVQVYSFAEPRDRGVTRVDASVLRLRYEDGPHDAEAMFVDPQDEHLYIVVKQLTESDSAVYAFPLADARPHGIGILREVASVALSTVTAADIGPAGIAIRDYLSTLVFPWADDRTVVSTLEGTPCFVSLGSSEAIAQTPDGTGLYSIREGVGPPIRYAAL